MLDELEIDHDDDDGELQQVVRLSQQAHEDQQEDSYARLARLLS